MTRSLSAAALAAIHASETGEAFLYLLTVSHPSITTLRFVRNTENVTSRGNVYTAFPFELTLADEAPDRPVEVRLVIDNVDREPLATLRGLTSPPTVTVEVITASTPNTVEISCPNLVLRGVTSDAFSVQGTLSFEAVLNEPWPGFIFNPVDFPAAF